MPEGYDIPYSVNNLDRDKLDELEVDVEKLVSQVWHPVTKKNIEQIRKDEAEK